MGRHLQRVGSTTMKDDAADTLHIDWPSWLASGPDTKVGQVYQMLALAGHQGVTQVEFYRWGIVTGYCTSVMERVRDLRKAARAAGQGDYVVAVREKSKDRRGTFRYFLKPYAPEPELFA